MFTKCHDMVINYRKLNPNGFYLLQYLGDPSLRYVFMYGGSSSGKSFSYAQTLLIMTLYDGENTLVMRKVGASILKTIYEDFKVACRVLGLGDYFTFRQNVVRCTNGARIDFSGLDDPEKIKGISNYKRVLLEELTEFDLQDFKQIRKRLRGKVGQQILASWNPISATHWIKKELFDRERWHDVPMECTIGGERIPTGLTQVKSLRMNAPRSVVNARTGEVEQLPSNMVAVQSTYLNNFWVVGSPDGTYGYYDEQLVADFEHDRLHDPDYYQVYALGEWGVIRTGSEFLGSFNTGRNTADLAYDPALPIHLSVDSNVLPYITTQFWQVSLEGGTHLRQIGELMAGNPDNTVRRAAGRVASRLRSMGYTGKVYLHGDASAKAANNIDDEKRSFMDLYISTLQSKGYEVEDMISSSNPSVAMSGEFANQVLEGAVEGVTMTIGRACSVSIDDYLSTQKDVNGGILKARVKDKTTMQTYEAHGHATDVLRYILCDVCPERFIAFSNRRKRNLFGGGAFRFYDPSRAYDYDASVVYVMPNVEGRLALMEGRRVGDRWHVTSVVYRDAVGTDVIASVLDAHPSDRLIVECSEAYFGFVREYRNASGRDVHAVREFTDMDRRIAATSDFVRGHVLFGDMGGEEAAAFMTSLMDYNKDSVSKQASALLSGFCQFVIKSYPQY